MRLLRSRDGKFVFSLNQVERRIFTDVLQLYPLVPASHQPLSKSLQGRQAVEAQHLLDEALAEQRSQHKAQLDAWLKAKSRFRRTKAGFNLTIRHAETEWLLQILNDIRVGSWLLLGSPEEHPEPDDIEPDLQHVWAALEVCSMFQMILLNAAEHQSPA